jgi:hypothetical protein
MKRTLISLVVFLALASCASCLDAKDGLVRVKVNDLNGRVSLYRLTDIKKSTYEPLLFDIDSRTSFLGIGIDGRLQKLGESQEFKVGTRRLGNGILVEYSSPVATVTQRIVFARSSDSRISNGFKISYEIRNISPRDFKVRLRQVWDTILGEKSGRHFATDKVSRVEEELIFTKESTELFVASPGEQATLLMPLKGNERPDRVVAANWKRLSDSAWYYDNLMRGFSLAPYSINDSAIAVYWDDSIIKAGASKVFSHFLITGGSSVAYLEQVARSGLEIAGETAAIPAPAPAAQQDTKRQMLLEIEALRQLLGSLDSAIQGDDALSEDELTSLLAQLEALQAEQQASDGQQP